MYTYNIFGQLSIPGHAAKNKQELTLSEIRKRGCRILGGDLGDIRFAGYTLKENDTVLYEPVLGTELNLTEDEATDVARDILMAAYRAIGTECVE